MEKRIRRTSCNVDPEVQEASTFHQLLRYFTMISKFEYKVMRLR